VTDLVNIQPRAKRLIRVFPRVTKATPKDDLAFFGPPDLFAEADEVHVDCTFTADKAIAERLAEDWQHVAPVEVGGVAYGDPGHEFVQGRYIKSGYTFTSRGCPRRCWFCSVWKRDPIPRLLPIQDGWNILDDNLLACPEPHVRAVFAMLRRQGRQIEFTGGLEAAALEDYQVGLLADLKPRPNCFFAYDPGDPFDTLRSAALRLLAAGFTACSHRLRVYVLIGYPKDTFEAAEKRLQQMLGIGFTPHAMLWAPETPTAERYRPADEWRGFQRLWARPAIIHGALKEQAARPTDKFWTASNSSPPGAGVELDHHRQLRAEAHDELAADAHTAARARRKFRRDRTRGARKRDPGGV
jgi:hypothetical protein